jgi:3,4-dehydroadipyl-CoA semialdehyde dehydrogenase
MHTLRSYLRDTWQAGEAPHTALHDPTTGAQVAQVSSKGLDLRAALQHARQVGGPTLRRMTFAQRGELLLALSQAIHTHRDALIDIARVNMGTTRGDAKFDIDGAFGTLAYYANLGKQLGDKTFLLDGEQIRISRSSRFLGQHVLTPRLGVAIHINAFNFPAWNMAEKAACALLAGVPVLAKPGTATAWVAEAVVQLWTDANLLPPGVFSLLSGGAGDLLDHVGPQDAIVFTGSGATGQQIRGRTTCL